jgi:hypothetical protein
LVIEAMKKSFLIAILIVLMVCELASVQTLHFGNAQSSSSKNSQAPQLQWSKTYPRFPNYSINGNPVVALDAGYSIIQTTDGGYAVGGVIDDQHYAPHTGGVDNRTNWLIKTNALGEVQWEKAISTYPLSIFQTKDSGFLISGDKQVLKIDANGNAQWNKTFEGPWSIWDYQTYYDMSSAIELNDGGFVFAGSIPDYFEDAVILKFDRNGDLMWNKTFSSDATYFRPAKILELHNGDLAVAGFGSGAWFARFDPNGILKVNVTLGEGYFSSFADVDDEGFVLAGATFIGGVANQGQGLLVRIDSQGTIKWNLTFNNPPYEGFSFSSIAVTGDGGYVVDGSSAMVKVNDFGKVLWNVTYVEANLGSIVAVTGTKDGGFAAVGSLDSSIWLAKFAPEPNLTPSPSIPELPIWMVLLLVLVGSIIIGTYIKKIGKKQ